MSDDKKGKFDGFLTDTKDAVEGEAYVVPGYIETQLSKEKRQECRGIVKTINEYGISQRQKLFLIYLLTLELENGELMKKIAKAIAECKDNVGGESKLVLEEKRPGKKILVS